MADANDDGNHDEGDQVEQINPNPSWPAFTRALAAIERSDVKALQSLYAEHGDPLTTQLLPDGTGTLLHYACRKAKRKCIVFLAEAGADPNAVDSDGETPLFWLATIARFDANTVEMLGTMVNVLCADVNHRDFLGRVALTYAVVRGAVDFVRRRRIETLLSLGADPRLRDFDEKAPIDYLGINTDGGVWMESLPENEREMRRCRELLQTEMNRRDNLEILLAMRAKLQEAAQQQPQPAPAAQRQAVETTEPSPAPTILVERRLVELECDSLFQMCMDYV